LGHPLRIYGDGYQARDILFVDDLVNAYLAAADRIDQVQGEVFNIGGGPANVVSLRELVDLLEERLGRRLQVCFDDWRPGDQKVYVSDNRKLRELLGWRPQINVAEGIDRLLSWVETNADLFETIGYLYDHRPVR
jgi:CDP-paratose 2-epimerase